MTTQIRFAPKKIFLNRSTSSFTLVTFPFNSSGMWWDRRDIKTFKTLIKNKFLKNLSLHALSCVCVSAYTCMHTHRVYIKCLPLLLHSSTFLFKQGLSWNLEFADLSRLAGTQTLGILLPLSPQLQENEPEIKAYFVVVTVLFCFLTQVLGSQLRPSCLHEKHTHD